MNPNFSGIIQEKITGIPLDPVGSLFPEFLKIIFLKNGIPYFLNFRKLQIRFRFSREHSGCGFPAFGKKTESWDLGKLLYSQGSR